MDEKQRPQPGWFVPQYGSQPVSTEPLFALLGLPELMDDTAHIPALKKGDRLVVVPTDNEIFATWQECACLKQDPDEWDWEFFAYSYRRAATVLVNWALATVTYSDTVLIPIVFLFRQYLEVVLKHLLSAADVALCRPHEIRKDHDLQRLWKKANRLLPEAFTLPYGEAWTTVGECIRQFNSWDGGSIVFRYPVDVRGQPPTFSVPDGPRAGAPAYHLNLRAFRDGMEKIANYLDDLAAAVDDELTGG